MSCKITVTKEKERRKRKTEEKERKALLVFIIATFGEFLPPPPKKKPFHANGPFGDKVVIKNPARYMNHVTVCPSVHIVRRPLFTSKPG